MNKEALHRIGVWLALADVGLAKYAGLLDALTQAGSTILRNKAKDRLREAVGMETPEWRQAQQELMRDALEKAKGSWETLKDYVEPEPEPEEEEPEEPVALTPESLSALFPQLQPQEPELPRGMFAPAEEKAPSLGEAMAVPTHESLM